MSGNARAATLPLVLGLACSQGEVSLPDNLSACENSECRAAWVVDKWPKDPAGITNIVRAEADPIVRLSLVLTLTEAFPGEVGVLCASLPEGGDARTRCEKINARPHLQAATLRHNGEKVSGDWRKAFGPLLFMPLPELSMGLEPLEVDCPLGSTEASCHGSAAIKAAHQGRPVDAVRHCLVVSDPLWADECTFIAAEAMAESGLGRQSELVRFTEASRMCTLATRFVPNCLAHLHNKLVRVVPKAMPAQANRWRERSRTVQGVGEGAAQIPAHLMSWYTAQLWSGMVASAVHKTPGASLDFLPVLAPVYQAFLWDALIWQAMRDSVQHGVRRRTLSGWVALAGNAPTLQTPTATARHQDSEGHNWVPYMGSESRPFHPVLALDLQVSVLKAAGELLPESDAAALFAEAQGTGDALLVEATNRIIALK